MTPYYEQDGVTVYCGDCLDVMPQLDEQFDTIITDPPWGIEFMGKDWDRGIPGVRFWQAALQVAKPGAMLLAFGGTRTHHRLMCAIEDAGWEIRDCINYVHDGSQEQAAFFGSLSPEQQAAYLELHYPMQMMSWAYGSGFPKSHSIGKAIDREEYQRREKLVLQALAEKGFTDVVWNTDHE